MEIQYKIKEIKEFKKDTIYKVLKRYYFFNGSDWRLIGRNGYFTMEGTEFETKDKNEAEQFINWCKLND